MRRGNEIVGHSRTEETSDTETKHDSVERKRQRRGLPLVVTAKEVPRPDQ